MDSLNSEVQASLQNRASKKATEVVEFLRNDLTNLNDAHSSWTEYCEEYGSVCFPITAKINSFEDASFEDFIVTENDAFRKVLIALSSATSEIRFLIDEARLKLFDPLLHYSSQYSSGSPLVNIGKLITYLQELACFEARAFEVSAHILNQLRAVSERNISIGSPAFYLHNLGKLFASLLTIDVIVKQNAALREDWLAYKSNLNACLHSAAACQKISSSVQELKDIEKLVLDLEKDVLSESIFAEFIKQCAKISPSKKFIDAVSLSLSALISETEAFATSNQDYASVSGRVMCIGTLVVLHAALSRTVEKRFLKSFLDFCRLTPIVPLWQNVSVSPADFCLNLIPDVSKFVDRKQLGAVTLSREAILQQKLQNLPKDVAALRTETMDWISRLHVISTDSLTTNDEEVCKFLLSGLTTVQRIHATIEQLFHFHSVTLRPMTRNNLMLIGDLIEILTVLRGCCKLNELVVTQFLFRLVSLYSARIAAFAHQLEKRLSGDRSNLAERVDGLTALMVLQCVLSSGPPTSLRMLVAFITLGVCVGVKKWPTEELSSIQSQLSTLHNLVRFDELFSAATDVSILYWNRQFIRPFLDEIHQNPVHARKLLWYIRVVESCAHSLTAVRHEKAEVLMEEFAKEVEDTLKEGILDKLCKEVETNLRLQVHSHLSLPERNPFDTPIRDIRTFLSLDGLSFFGRYIVIRNFVEEYLDRTFYDLTTVALHDWRTYDEMRTLADHLYGLNVLQAHLPCQTLEQGADILEIMRNINVFVSNYAYNLNNQVFVERTSNSKHLNTIGIRHVANSLRTHGFGVMSTTVNYTYQFLRKKFNQFSQFMFDEHIKSRLIKDIKVFKERKQADAAARYPFERAEKFNKDIRVLGVTADGQTRLDQLRTLITHIGNAMGFVRNVRSGGLHHSSKATCFIPDLEDIESFEKMLKDEFPIADATSAKNVDDVLATMSKTLSGGTEFFKLLVDVFSSEFRNTKNRHLHNFYMIVPPLMVNFVEHLVTCKERLQKRNPTGLVLFTDDGFAMGVAYILCLLDQNRRFDSLNWNDSVREKFAKDLLNADLSKTGAGGRNDPDDEKLRQTLRLTARRLDTYIRDYELLFYNLNSARIFFKTGGETDQKND